MKKNLNEKITIATNSCQNVLHFLKGYFNIVTDYYLSYKAGEIIKNFDIFLMFDGNEENDLSIINQCELLNIPIIGTRRYSKSIQMLILDNLKINHPTFYKIYTDTNRGYRDDSIYQLLDSYDDNEKFIFKSDNGARGVGQALMNKTQLYDLMDFLYKSNNGVNTIESDQIDTYIKSKFDIDIGGSFSSPEEKSFIFESLKTGDYSVQEKLNIKEEIRYISFYKENPIMVQRTVGKHWQANSSITREGNYIEEHEKKLEMKSIADRLIKYLNTPFLSIDFYINDKEEIGIFEFQMQMGYSKVPKFKLVEYVNKSVNNLINEKNGNNTNK